MKRPYRENTRFEHQYHRQKYLMENSHRLCITTQPLPVVEFPSPRWRGSGAGVWGATPERIDYKMAKVLTYQQPFD
jgi:hypothetical protein